MERTADELERASNITLEQEAEAIAAVRRLAAPEQDPNNIDPYCIDCGLDIEPQRLKHLRARCFCCQDRKEKHEKRFARR